MEKGLASSQISRLKALQEKHAILSNHIREEEGRPSAMDFYIRQLKKKRLYLKEKIESIRSTSASASGE